MSGYVPAGGFRHASINADRRAHTLLTWNVELIGGRRLVLHGERNGGNGHLRLLGSHGGEVVVPVVEHGWHAKAAIELDDLVPGTYRVEGTKLTDDTRTGPGFVLSGAGELRRVRLRADTDGRLDLDVVPLERHAEARRLRVEGTVLELSLGEEGTVVARPRGEHARDVAGDGTSIDLAALARRGSGDETWRLWLSTASGEQLRIARHHDGVPGKRRLAALPTVVVGRSVVRLRYTDDDQLAVTCEAAPRRLRPRRRESASLRRRALGGPAILLHRLALALVGALPARPARAGGTPSVRFLLANAYGMGGTIRATLNLAGELAARREVEVISVRRHQVRPFFAAPDGVSVRSLDDCTARRGPLLRLLAALPSVLVHPEDHAYLGASLLTDVRLVRRLRRAGGDVIVTTRPAYALIAAAAAPPDAVVVAQEHLHFDAHRPRLGRAVRRAYGKVDVLTVLTESDRAAYAGVLDGRGTRVVRMPGVRLPPGSGVSSTAAPVVVAAGRLTPQKGFDMLVRAFAPVARAHEDWQLRIYGGGPDRDALRELIVAEGLHDHVLLMGSTGDIGDALAEGSIFVLSSRFEGFGMVVVEAMSRGLPVVSFDCPHGPAETITHGVDGLLVGPEDVDGLSAAIEELVVDPARRARMGAAALEAAQAYGPASVAAGWESLLAELRPPGAPES